MVKLVGLAVLSVLIALVFVGCGGDNSARPPGIFISPLRIPFVPGESGGVIEVTRDHYTGPVARYAVSVDEIGHGPDPDYPVTVVVQQVTLVTHQFIRTLLLERPEQYYDLSPAGLYWARLFQGPPNALGPSIHEFWIQTGPYPLK